ncbi:uncharacterized protein LOC130757541 isoform X1 [Actinidia eriantha]|uniref:uncharacterized protein LOC130757541 isoform X1 n=2 Tax=Actinidia eriantha TaxID=165200 RepID=UPI002584ECAB|nr:uncharacterized protein LOC130757541 isoform X1 [Actinidia eriantha]XP_057468273.1 uncharacterized protein LOC130757541 isoform X1 [Actinidia eriantha]XP_057468274.1 uncharacterized protein LOC130757541 isoform X1 [Actinidia eriantha]XP_057468275.1 uncharacterized protein LOC130757541 isoform X1 [Actinidia eriantha]XP_057468276.1 uncharacterized protein LOC130757541 isoform X1 [Actinidia eriantha]XP_057468277.1 uncharacterized protein LOC130757541 isoform X1 [Actinidia eriantha]XP_05746827
MATKKLRGSGAEKSLSSEEQQAKIDEIRKLMGPITSKFPVICSDASMLRYLRARNWNTKKASKMLKETLKWRLEHKTDKIQWEDIAHEAKIGKLYIANYCDKHGRTVLIMRPGVQSTSPIDLQIKYLVYCMERAILNLKPDQEQMIWLIDFQGWTMSSISVKVTRETARVLQERYPERLGLAILYNPPKVFESFWLMVKPFLEPKTYKKVRFVFADNPQSRKIMEDLFDMEKLECVFGGTNSLGYDYGDYVKRMTEVDNKMTDSIDSRCLSPCPSIIISESESPSELASDEEGSSSNDEIACSTLEGVDDQKIEDLSLSCKTAANVEVDATSKRGETE